MAFKDLRSFLDGPLELPVGGKTYVVPQMSAAAGLELQTQQDLPEKQQIKGLEGYRPLLTDAVFDQMLKDKLTTEEMIRCALTVHVDALLGREAAEKFFGLGEIPKALTEAANRRTRRSTRTAGASTTTGRGTTTSTRRTGKTTSTTSTRQRSSGRAS